MVTKVLIVDDEVLIREEIVEFLENEGFICVEAENGADGLDLLCRDFEISIVISDLVMPVYSGLDMVNDAQSAIGKVQDLEFIIVTGQGREKEAIAALNLGVMDFLHKPIDLEHLAHVVRRAEELVFLKRESREYKIALEEDVQLKTKRFVSSLIMCSMRIQKRLSVLLRRLNSKIQKLEITSVGSVNMLS